MPTHHSALPDEGAIDAAALAALLNVTRETVYRQARAGDIPGVRVGRSWRFFPSVVLAHLNRPRDPWAQSRRSTARRRGPRANPA